MLIAVCIIVFAFCVVALGSANPNARKLYYDVDFNPLYAQEESVATDSESATFEQQTVPKSVDKTGKAENFSQDETVDAAALAQELFDSIDI